MSKAVTNEEVEDVLSSIRRLVSEDKRPLAGLRAAPNASVPQQGPTGAGSTVPADAAAPASDTPVVDRLVLTPALRVTDPSEPADTGEVAEEGPLDLGSVARQTWTPDEGECGAKPDQATVADAMAYQGPMMLFPAAHDSVRAEDRDAAMDALDALVHDAVEAELRNGDAAHDDNDLADSDYSDEGYWEDDVEVSGTDGEPTDPAGPDAPDEGSLDRSAEIWQPHEGSDTATEILEDGANDRKDVERETASVTHIPLTAKIAALEAAVGKITGGWEPDGDESDDLVVPETPSMAWQDDVELDAKGAPFSNTEAAEQDVPDPVENLDKTSAAAAPSFGGDDQVMDEEALRDLVAEIVRSELQGALGERITRNVRKLVRREIHRALTAQEME
jgi:hypothetical protein